MNSLVYIFSKFTEEFLLLFATLTFALLAMYCYHWVIKKRRLGASRDLVPGALVREYLNQLIGEAHFVRTQLFGILGHPHGSVNTADLTALLGKGRNQDQQNFSTGTAPEVAAPTSGGAPTAAVSQDLLDRLEGLQGQLSEKEGYIININIEKKKLAEEIENLKQNQTAAAAAGASSNNDDLLKRLKELEARLEEYSVIEDDLANLKRLQQENIQLKKRIEESSAGVASTAAAAISEPAIALVKSEPALTAAPEPVTEEAPAPSLDQAAIDALLDGVPAVPTASSAAAPATAPADQFEQLASSVNTSLEPSTTETPQPVAAATTSAAPPVETASAKSDEELLKEFENLLNN